MKRSLWFVLVASLAANAVFLSAVVRRRAEAAVPVPSRPEAAIARDAEKKEGSATAHAAASKEIAPLTTAEKRKMWEALSSRDPATFAANLRAAGFSLGAVRGAVYALLRDLQTADREKAVNLIPVEPYWKSPSGREANLAYSKEISRLWLERDRVMRSIFPEEQQAFEYKMQARFGPISPASMEKISALDQDYAEMRQQVSQSQSGLRMPWSGEQLNYLEKEKARDMAAFLTPQEFEQYQMRNSSTGLALQRQLVGFDATEQEYRDIFKIRAAYDQAAQAGGMTFGMSPEGMKLIKDQAEQLKTTLGETRYADYQRSNDTGYRAATTAAQRFGLPATTATAVYQIQQDMQQRATEISANQSQTAAERESAVSALTAETKKKLSTVLTPEGFEHYMRDTGGTAIMWRGPRVQR